MPKKVIIRLALIAAVILAALLAARLVGGAIFSFVSAAVLTFVVEFVAVALIAMFGFGPIGTKSPSPATVWSSLLPSAFWLRSLWADRPDWWAVYPEPWRP